MGGCASRPKDLDVNEPAPVEAPAAETTESETVAQENNGGEETKTEDPLVNVSEPTTGEAKTEEEAAETKTEEKVEANAEAEAAPAAVASDEAEKATEGVKEDEAKTAETPKSEDKSDAPLVTM